MRNKSYILLLLVMFAALGEVAAQDMRSLFVNAPDTIFPLLTRTNREDCVDFLDAKMRARVSNRLDGKSELVVLTRSFLELQSSGSSTVQMKLLPFGGDSIISVVRTVCAEACSSRINFYKRDWSSVDISFVRPAVEDFFVSADSIDEALSFCDIYLVKLSLSSTDNTLVAEYTMPLYMNEEDAAFVSRRLSPILYRWNGSAFVKE